MPDDKQQPPPTPESQAVQGSSAAAPATVTAASSVGSSTTPSQSPPHRPTLAQSIKAVVTSVPAMFTAVAGSVAAVTALLTALNNASWMRPATPTPVPTVAVVVPTVPTAQAATPATATPAPTVATPLAALPSAAPTTPPTIVPTPTSAAFLLVEDFSDATSGWEQHNGEDYACGYRDGGYFIRVGEPQQVVWLNTPGNRVFRDVSVEVDALRSVGPSDNLYGIVARVAPEGHFYFFAISSDGYAIVQKSEGGGWKDLTDWVQPSSIRQGESNRLRAELLGTALRFYVNGTLVAEVTETTLTEGEIGLAAGSFDEAGVEVLFDMLRIEVIERL